MTLETGTRLGRFVIEQKLGKGAAGVVYRATDTRLQQTVALKLLHSWLAEDVEVLARFKREIVLTRRISHPGVCRLHDLHEEDGQTFITMEYVEGPTLASVIMKEGRLSPTATLEVLRGMAAPLDAAHAAGVIHRDLKPGNVLVKRDGTLCILDFGMATADDVTKITRAGRTVGSLRFIAPEVWEGSGATPASDRYALGVILYACLAGRLPFEAATPLEAFEAQKQELTSLSQHNQRVTPAVNNVVRKMMSRVPADRYSDAAAMVSAFELAMGVQHAPSAGTEGSGARARAPSSSVLLWDGATDFLEARTETVDRDRPSPVPPPAADGLPRMALLSATVVGVVVLAAVVGALVTRPSAAKKFPAPTAALVATAEDEAPRQPAIAKEQGAPIAKGERAGEGEPRRPSSGAGAKSAPSGAATAKTGALAVIKKRGLIEGDIPRLDAELARVRALDKSGKDPSPAWEKARTIAAQQVIDRGFITSKQKRLRFAAERTSSDAQGKIGLLTSEAERLVVARKYAAANDTLNKAFALVK